MMDREAWAQLADIYLSKQRYSEAAFCYEEMLMIEPNNPHLHYKYASVRTIALAYARLGRNGRLLLVRARC